MLGVVKQGSHHVEVILIPENDRDITRAELAELAGILKGDLLNDGFQVDVIVTSTEEFGAGLSWDEVLNVVIPLLPSMDETRGAIVGIILERTLSWMRARFRRRPDEAERSRVIRVYSPDGSLVTIIELDSEDGTPRVSGDR